MHRAYALISLSLLLGACEGAPPKREWTPADHGQPQAAPSDRAPSDETPQADDGIDRAARALWTASCASCHGRDGKGQGEARPPGAQMPDFTQAAWQSSRSDEVLAKTIHDGRGLMPAFGKQLNEHGIAALVQHIRVFAAAPKAETDLEKRPEP